MLPVLPVVDFPASDTAPAALTSLRKRALDVGLALFLLVAFSPLWLLCSLLIKLTSRGPVIFRQERIGVGGKPFTVYKFRTMRVNTSDEVHRAFVTSYILGSLIMEDGAAYKLPRDVRVTAIGRILRKLSLDEIPQLINVLRGDMSLIGPRPELGTFVRLFEEAVHRYGDRHRVKSGITGWAQVHGLRGNTSLTDRVEWDNYYIENWSLWLDMKIAVMTVGSLLRWRED
jgi:exopolysaccharide biosynthesis polyprenyl glycosylphosphotransferase